MVGMEQFELAKDKIMMGAERRSMVMSEKEKRNTAYHEAGHAIVGRLVPEHDPVYKVSIIPRGRALGVTMFLPEEDRYSQSKRAIFSQLCSLYGGRIAEELTLGEDGVTTGASNDIQRATEIARNMVTKWGLSEKLGPLTYDEGGEEVFLGRSAASPSKSISGETAKLIDQEVRRLIDDAYSSAKQLLEDNIDKLHAMSDALMHYETLDADQLDDIMEGKEPRPPSSWDDDGPASGSTSEKEQDSDSEDPIGGPAVEH
jgi:cell division protease FtsH